MGIMVTTHVGLRRGSFRDIRAKIAAYPPPDFRFVPCMCPNWPKASQPSMMIQELQEVAGGTLYHLTTSHRLMSPSQLRLMEAPQLALNHLQAPARPRRSGPRNYPCCPPPSLMVEEGRKFTLTCEKSIHWETHLGLEIKNCCAASQYQATNHEIHNRWQSTVYSL